MKIWFCRISIKVSFFKGLSFFKRPFLEAHLYLKITYKHESKHLTMAHKQGMTKYSKIKVYSKMEIKTLELTEPTINQIQKPNFKNKQR